MVNGPVYPGMNPPVRVQNSQGSKAGGFTPTGGMPAASSRFRSFAERYVLARASVTRSEYADEDTWRLIQDAKRAYRMIEHVGRVTDD